MKAVEISIALLDDLIIAAVLILAPTIIAYELNIIGFGELLVLTISFIAIAAFIVYKVAEVHRREVRTGIEAYKGRKAIVVDVRGSKVKIMVEGELWNAEVVSDKVVNPGDEVIIIDYHDGKFKVKPSE